MPQAAGLLLGSSLETVILLSADCKLGLAGDRNIRFSTPEAIGRLKQLKNQK